MSVLIKSMKMPTSCSECALNYDCFKCIVTGTLFFDHEHNFDDETTRLDNCPLIEIPPHGRLIDADAPIPLVDTHGKKIEVTVAHIIENNLGIVNAIIEAEEGR